MSESAQQTPPSCERHPLVSVLMEHNEVVTNAWLKCDAGQIGPREHIDFYISLTLEKEEDGYHFIRASKTLGNLEWMTNPPLFSAVFQLKKGCYSISVNK